MKITDDRSYQQAQASVRRCQDGLAKLETQKKKCRELITKEAIDRAADSFLRGGELRNVLNHAVSTLDIRKMILKQALKNARESLRHFKKNWKDPENG